MEVKEDIKREIFREYDIRGEYKTQIDESTAYTIGLAVGTKLKSLEKKTCVIGHDNRISHEELTNALIEGILSTGINIKYLGLVTTPMYYFACMHLRIDSGIMVTASHNPVNDNGFKITLDSYDNACGDAIKELYNICVKKEFATGLGHLDVVDITDTYTKRIIKDINIEKRLKIVVDPANATTSIIVHDIFDKLNVDVVYINDESDGTFPNHHPDPSVKENMISLQEKVLEVKADVGFGYDGDGDRLGIVDEKGNLVKTDTFMAIVWGDIMPKCKNKTALFDVKCSKQLEDEILRLGGKPYIYRTGNSFQKNKIKELNLAFGGEYSGHVFFRDRFAGFDDGIYASLRLLEIMSKNNKKLSELYQHMNKYFSTEEIKIKTTEEQKFKIVDAVKKYCKSKKITICTVDGVRAKYKDGWALVRASNTGPNLTMRFEARTIKRLKQLENEYTKLVKSLNKK